jgi:hypothetical protein
MSADGQPSRPKRHAGEILCQEQECNGFGKPVGVGHCEACCASRGVLFKRAKAGRKLDLTEEISDAKIDKSSPKKTEVQALMADTAQANLTFEHREMQRKVSSEEALSPPRQASPERQATTPLPWLGYPRFPGPPAGSMVSSSRPDASSPNKNAQPVSSVAAEASLASDQQVLLAAVSSPSKQSVSSVAAEASAASDQQVLLAAVSSPSKQPVSSVAAEASAASDQQVLLAAVSSPSKQPVSSVAAEASLASDQQVLLAAVSSPSKQSVSSVAAEASLASDQQVLLAAVSSPSKQSVSSVAAEASLASDQQVLLAAVSSPSKQPVSSVAAEASAASDPQVLLAAAVSSDPRDQFMWSVGTNVLVSTMHKPNVSPKFLYVGIVHAVVWNKKYSKYAYNIQKENSSVITRMVIREFVFKLQYPAGDITRFVGKLGRRDAVTFDDVEGRGGLHSVALDHELDSQYGSLHMDQDVVSTTPSCVWFEYHNLWPEAEVAADPYMLQTLGMDDAFDESDFPV